MCPLTPTPTSFLCCMMQAHLGQFWLGEARLAHLGGLAHGDVTLCEGTL